MVEMGKGATPTESSSSDASNGGPELNILLLVADCESCSRVGAFLKDRGMSIETSHDGEHGLRLAIDNDYDVIIVERDLSRLDGISVLKRLRTNGLLVPVLFFAPREPTQRRLEAFDAGADDCQTTPVILEEVQARILSLVRRNRTKEPSTLRLGDLEIDLVARQVFRDGKAIALQPREFKLLEFLVRRAGRVLDRSTLLLNVWNLNIDPGTNVVETHISRLRSKIDSGKSVKMIRTVRGYGYSISAIAET